MGLVNHCEMVGFLVKIVNVEKCFEIVFTNRKNINTFAPKLGLWSTKWICYSSLYLTFMFLAIRHLLPGTQYRTQGTTRQKV